MKFLTTETLISCQRIKEFVAKHPRYPSVEDLRKADTAIWEEISARETAEMLHEAASFYRHGPKIGHIAFKYWLYWLQQKKFRLTNDRFAYIMELKYNNPQYITNGLAISRLKSGRKFPDSADIAALFALYSLTPTEKQQLRRKVLQKWHSNKVAQG